MRLWAVSSKLGQDGFREWLRDIGSADFRLSNGTALIILPKVLTSVVGLRSPPVLLQNGVARRMRRWTRPRPRPPPRRREGEKSHRNARAEGTWAAVPGKEVAELLSRQGAEMLAWESSDRP